MNGLWVASRHGSRPTTRSRRAAEHPRHFGHGSSRIHAMAETASQTITIAAAPGTRVRHRHRLRAVSGVGQGREGRQSSATATSRVARSRSSSARRRSAAARTTRSSYDYTNAPHVLGWKMLRGDIMRTIDGAYHFSETADGGTEVRYDLAIDLVVPLPGLREAPRRGAHPQHGARAEGPRRGMTPTRRAGIDVGGTKCLGVVVDETGASLAEQRRPTPTRWQTPSSTRWLEFADELAPYDTLGVGVPGLVTRQGVLRAAPNLDRRVRGRGRPTAARAARASRRGRQRRHLRGRRRVASSAPRVAPTTSSWSRSARASAAAW